METGTLQFAVISTLTFMAYSGIQRLRSIICKQKEYIFDFILAEYILYEMKLATHLLLLEYSSKLAFLLRKFIMTGNEKPCHVYQAWFHPQCRASCFLLTLADVFFSLLSGSVLCSCP